ncbi:MAG: ABC transporter permease subunit [Acidimicrobiales bacterium]
MRPELVVAATTARRAARSGLAWGAVFAVYVASSAATYASAYPTLASRARFATSLAGNAGLGALFGPARHLDTVAGFTSWRTMGGAGILGAIWGLLLATRLTRGEEDEGRWELLLTGPTTRRRAAAQAIVGLGAGLVTLWAVTAASTAAVGSSSKVGFSIGASLFVATALVGDAAVFLAVGALAAQLAGTRRQANGIAGLVLGASFLVRVVADSGSGVSWLRWATPLGWAEELRPLVGSKPFALVPIATFLAIVAAVTVRIAGDRDLGSSVLPTRDTPPAHTGLLGGPERLVVRLGGGVAGGWIAGLAVLGIVLGLVAQSASGAISGSATIERAIARLGGYRIGAATYLGIAFLLAAGLVTFVAAGQIAATRAEEADGSLDHLVVRLVGRRRWMAGRLAFGACLVIVASVIAGIAAWAGAATQHSGIGFSELTKAGFNIAAPALFVLGIGAFAYGVWPRRAPTITYSLVAWSVLVELVASVAKINTLILDSSVLSHITPAPAAAPNWTGVAWLVGLGLLAAAGGIVGFGRRDLVGR